jgi:hypothetical protein
VTGHIEIEGVGNSTICAFVEIQHTLVGSEFFVSTMVPHMGLLLLLLSFGQNSSK